MKAADNVRASGLKADTRKALARVTPGFPFPEGDGRLGIYNAIQSQPRTKGFQEVIGGTSYLQLVSFTEDGPVAKGLLAHSQSSNPSSPHFRNQTVLFSRQEWPVLPFTRKQIEADPSLQTLRLWAQK